MDEDLKRCSRCEIKKVIENFSKERKCKDGLCPLCKCCRKDYYLKHLNKNKIYNEKIEGEETYISKTNEKHMLIFV